MSSSKLPAAAALVAVTLAASLAGAQEPPACRSPNPADWPPPAKPYFLLAVDTSGSMTTCAPGNNPTDCNGAAGTTSNCNAATNSCGLPATRIDGARCALSRTIQAYGGLVSFGLSGFAGIVSACNQANCQPCRPGVRCDCRQSAGGGFDDFDDNGDVHGCNLTPLPDANNNGGFNLGCGNTPTTCSAGGGLFAGAPLGAGFRNGGNILVPMVRDPAPVPGQNNVAELLQWFDARPGQPGGCLLNREIWANGHTPLEGILRTAHHYLFHGWDPRWSRTNYCAANPFGGGQYPMFPAPLTASEPACRSTNVILVTDGAETCGGTGASAAAALLASGVRTYVINFIGGDQAATDAIAAAGGTTVSFFASNEVQLAQQLSSIVAGSILPEVCNNIDDNCNGCTDEGFQVYCNRGKQAVASPTVPGQCCSWTTQAQRNACVATWQSTVTPSKPLGDQFELPCWVPGSQPAGFTAERSWLCANPGEICDNLDNNCDGACAGSSPWDCGFDPTPPIPNGVDEGITKCGSPLQCPVAETCDGQDNNCDGITDNAPGSPLPFSLPGCSPCVPSQEICNGCDDDCDGVVDDGITPIPCGFTQAAPCGSVCAGTRSCGAPASVAPGACLPGFPANRLGACSTTPRAEACNRCDDDCDGLVDEGIPATVCDVPGQPGLNYGPNSRCRRGMQPCNGVCTGFVGPSAEICDGIDNNCNGQVDEGVPGVGIECGSALGECRKGTTACVAGVIVCQGGTPPQPETCNGLDDDCDGTTDDAPLNDAPTNTSCWDLGGTCSPQCTHAGFNWCPPPGATCTGTGTLTAPCKTGTLACNGLSGWRCVGGTTPSPEVCDGADNDCNGPPDDGLGSPIGDPCGSSIGECRSGTNLCDMGNVVCDGEVGPTPEVCDGKDNDCDGTVDNGIPLGSACDPPYDTALYPGDRTKGECRPGNLQCDMMGNTICVSGVGPQPEICDGKDNDCDGQTDEVGPAPDGINGTTNPLDPTQAIGDTCGTDEGECKTGRLGCTAGRFVCLGAVGPQPEICDCADNDCDGVVDDGNGDGGPALCSAGKTCVDTGGSCSCAEPCRSGEFRCPTGTSCRSDVTVSGTTTPAGDFCIPFDPCGNCSVKTAFEPQGGGVECAPAGTQGLFTPACVCKGQFGCHSPCFNVTCPSGLDCVEVGALTGRCEDPGNCHLFGCPVGAACRSGVCVTDPCEPNTCPAATPVCKPDANFDATCVGSCAGVDCGAGEKCVSGACVATGCSVDCAAGEVCRPDGDGGFACGPSACASVDGGLPCMDGSYCDPSTGACGDHPCTGVACPMGQVCAEGECVERPSGTGGTGGTAGTTGVGGASGAGATGGTGAFGGTSALDGSAAASGGPSVKRDRGVFGLATGGGGCACRTGTAPTSRAPLALMLMALALAARRRRA